MFVTRKKKTKTKKTQQNKQCKQDISIYHEQIKRIMRCYFIKLVSGTPYVYIIVVI
jgi:hypothetical protein